jgi:hypothetical protein
VHAQQVARFESFPKGGLRRLECLLEAGCLGSRLVGPVADRTARSDMVSQRHASGVGSGLQGHQGIGNLYVVHPRMLGAAGVP